MLRLIRDELGLSYAEAGLLFSMPLLMLSTSSLLSGLISDRLGLRKVVGAGSAMLALGGATRGLMVDLYTGLASGLLFGLGLAMVFPNLSKAIRTHISQEGIAYSTSIYSLGFPTGALVAISLSATVIMPLLSGWRQAFLLFSLPPSIACALWWIMVKDGKGQEQKARAISPLFEPNAVLLALTFFSAIWFFFSFTAWLPTFLEERGLGLASASIITSLAIIGNFISLPLFPMLSDRLGRRPFLYLPGLILAIDALAVSITPASMSHFPSLVVGIATGSVFVMVLILPAEMVSKEQVGRISGLVFSLGFVGGLLGPWLTGFVRDLSGSPSTPMLTLSLVGLASSATGLMIKETKRPASH